MTNLPLVEALITPDFLEEKFSDQDKEAKGLWVMTHCTLGRLWAVLEAIRTW